MKRPTCARCLRPTSACWCAHLPHLQSRTRVVFLQHPREHRVAIGTCRMAHLALANSELHVGVRFDDEARVAEIAALPGTMVLFPDLAPADHGRGRDLAALDGDTLRQLIVVDGTWSQARKLLARSPLLAGLPRLAFVPSRPSNYRIRSEPKAECVSTIEAVVEVLGLVEGAPDRFRGMLGAFEAMVDTQLRCAAARVGPRRSRRPRARTPSPRLVPPEILTRAADLVALYVEANAWPSETGGAQPAELIQLVAQRPATGERFAAILAPSRALAPHTPAHLELPPARFLDGEARESALARFAAFVRPGDLFCVWGPYAQELLRHERAPERPLLDLRPATSRFLLRRPGGLEEAAALLDGGAPSAPTAGGRADRRLDALCRVLRGLAAPPPLAP